MDMNGLGLFRLIKGKMDWLTQRQEVVAHNIANADTPGYRPSDLTPFTFRAALGNAARLPQAQTSAGHLTGTAAGGGPAREVTERKPYETAPDGNGVVLEEQLLKISRTGTEYNMAINLYRKHMGLIRTAIGRAG